jgi:hypothetical protein
MLEARMRSTFAAAFMALVALGAVHAPTARAICTAIDCPAGPPPPSRYVSTPDMAVQFKLCLTDSSAIGAFVDGIRQQLVGAMQQLDTNHDDPPPVLDVRHSCIGGKSTFGIWFAPVNAYGGTDTSTARNVGLAAVDPLTGMEKFAFAFSPAGLSHLVQIAWQDQPRRYNDYGYVDPSGPIHFTDFQVRFNVYNTLQNPLTGAFVSGPSVDLGIDGFYSYIQDTDFTLHVVDFPRTTMDGALHCDTLLLAETTETTIDTILATLTGGAGDLPPTLTLAGPACRVADFLPTQVLVRRTPAKIELTYSRASADGNGGLILAGDFTLGLRQPSVSIDGPSEVQVHGEQSVTESYLGLGNDLRPPVTVTWTSPDAIAISGADTVRPTVTWSVAGLAVNDFVERSIQLTAVDADGVTATAVQSVIIRRLPTVPGGGNPVCRAKPWLPMCQDPGDGDF